MKPIDLIIRPKPLVDIIALLEVFHRDLHTGHTFAWGNVISRHDSTPPSLKFYYLALANIRRFHRALSKDDFENGARQFFRECADPSKLGSMDFSVDKVAELAYLELTDSERQEFEAQFKEILQYVDQLQEVKMTDDEAKAMGAFHVQTEFYRRLGQNFSENLRYQNKDQETFENLKLSNEEALRNAPKSGGLPGELLFEVPSIIES